MLDFPNAPTLNQQFQNYQWDGEKWTSYALPAVPPQSVLTQRGWIAGLTMQPGTTTLTVSPGIAADSSNTTMLNLAAAMTKTVALWSPGSNGGALDTGVMATSTYYSWYLIYNPTTLAVDLVFSATATPDAGPSVMPSGFTKYRRIGCSRWTNSNAWAAFVQSGDEFLFATPAVMDVNGAALNAASRQYAALTVPYGIIVEALCRVTVAGGASITMILTSPLELDLQPGGNIAGVTVRSTAASDGGSSQIRVRTDTQCRVGVRSNIAGSWYCLTYGYIDRRGKDA